MYKTTVKVEGMMCSMCESHVNDAIRKAMDVKSVKSSHSKNETEIISESIPNKDSVVNVINATGYTASDVKTETYEKKGFFKGLFK